MRDREGERGIANESTKESAHFTQLKLLPAIFLPFVAAAKRHLSVSVTASFMSLASQPSPAQASPGGCGCGLVDNAGCAACALAPLLLLSWQPFYFSFAGNFRYN